MITLYHYTSAKSAENIKKEKCIRASCRTSTYRDDAAYGNGVYLTSLGPENGKAKLQKLWGDGTGIMEKLEYVITIKLPRNEVKNVDKARNIDLYDGDLNLKNYSYTIEVFN